MSANHHPIKLPREEVKNSVHDPRTLDEEKRDEKGGENGGTHITFPANHLVAVVLARERLEAGLDDAPAQTQHQVQGAFLFSRPFVQPNARYWFLTRSLQYIPPFSFAPVLSLIFAPPKTPNFPAAW